jgi:tetratricopeptide (TPR) repeat protein
MMLPLLLLAAMTDTGPPAPTLEARFNKCVDLATRNPDAAAAEAGRWQLAGGGSLARQCLGIAYANSQRWAAAAAEFEGAAHAAEIAKNPRAALYWAQGGNAWLAAKEPVKARAALDAALAAGTLTGLDRGEAYLDRARAQVAGGQLEGARVDIDQALVDAPADPLAWLLSATLARKMDDLPRAKKDIAEALKRSGDDAAVQLEAGNIAALGGDADGAKAAWRQAASIAPDSAVGKNAQTALAQFDTVAKP